MKSQNIRMPAVETVTEELYMSATCMTISHTLRKSSMEKFQEPMNKGKTRPGQQGDVYHAIKMKVHNPEGFGTWSMTLCERINICRGLAALLSRMLCVMAESKGSWEGHTLVRERNCR